MYRKNTASQYIYFALVNASTGAALTGATVTAYRALDNGAQASATGSTTELANGQYRFNLSQADTNADYGSYLFTATNAVPVEKTVVFTGANPTDAAGFGLSRLDAAVSSRSTIDAAGVRTAVGLASANLDTQFSGIATAVWAAGTRTLTSFGSLASDVWAVATRTLTAVSDSSGVTTLLSRIQGTLASGTHNPQSGDAFARLGAPTGASIAADIQTRATEAQVQAAIIDELSNRNYEDAFSTLGAQATNNYNALASQITTVAGYVDTEVSAIKTVTDRLNTMMVLDGAVYQFTANALELAPTGGGGGGGPTASEIADAVWDELVSGHSVTGSFGAKVLIASSTQREVQVTGSNHVAADVHAFQTDVITSTALAASAVTEIQSGLATQALLTTVAGYLDTEIAAIKAKTDNLPTDPADQSAVEAAITTAKNEIISSLPGTGSGARSVTITVRDPSAVAVQNALVRVSRAGESFNGTTNASGVVTFSLDDATWTVTITATGFSFTPTTLVVDGTETVTYTLVSTGGISPSPAGQTTGYWTVYDQSGNAEVGATIVMQTMNPASGSTGLILEDATRTAISGAGGLVQFTGLFKGATYRVYRQGSQRYHTVTVPTTAGASVALGSIVG